jgi:small subunit ribosomal protein S21
LFHVRSKYILAERVQVSGQASRWPGKETISLDITVRGNDIERALRDLKRTLQKEGFFKEIKKRKHYEKPSVKKKRKQAEAARRRRKALRFRRPERD